MSLDDVVPFVVHGTTASYFTGKLEAYLRAKGLPYRLAEFSPRSMRRCIENTGLIQLPQVECSDGTWLVDTTLIIEHLERLAPEPRITPASAPVAFIGRLIEDYADEWLWRPAMHFRWSYPESARLMSAWLAEHIADRPGPEWIKRLWWRRRQLGIFVKGDGVTRDTRAAVEASYLSTLDALELIFSQRSYVLGERPTEADFGLFGPMFRHFFCDPVPARIMRERAPAVQEWVARMWNIEPQRFAKLPMPEAVPGDLHPLLRAIAECYLPYLDANAEAYAKGRKQVTYRVGETIFKEPVKPYRVWCRDRLQDRLAELAATDRSTIEGLLPFAGAIARLAAPSPRPAQDIIGTLPLIPGQRRPKVDSWWR